MEIALQWLAQFESFQASLGAEMALRSGWTARIDGLMARSTGLPLQRQLNGSRVTRPYPTYDDVYQLLSKGLARSQSLTLGLRRDRANSFIDVHYAAVSIGMRSFANATTGTI